MSASLSEQQLADIAARAERVRAMKFVTGLNAASGHFDTPVERELYRLAATCWNALQAQLKDSDALLAEIDRRCARVAELEAERHTTNEALDDTVKAIRDANTAAGLVAEYHVPTTDGWWLAVRREPNGDRWAVYTASRLILGGRQTWTGDHWISIALATDSELWAYDSADAALAEATRLAETTEAVAS